jgi:hypothetical protein
MKIQTAVKAFAALLALVLAGVSAMHAIDVYQAANKDAKFELLGSILLAALSAIGGLYVLFFTRQTEREKTQLAGAIAQLNKTVDNAQQLNASIFSGYANAKFKELIEPRLRELGAAADSATRFVELEYQEDFRKRQRRDSALLALSAALIKTTRSFRALTKFRLAEDESTDSLVNVLAQALAARENFLATREELLVLRVAEERHLTLLRQYTLLLSDIIIDLRRSPVDASATVGQPSYAAVMEQHLTRLQTLDAGIGKLLVVFLAPRHRVPVLPDIPSKL